MPTVVFKCQKWRLSFIKKSLANQAPNPQVIGKQRPQLNLFQLFTLKNKRFEKLQIIHYFLSFFCR